MLTEMYYLCHIMTIRFVVLKDGDMVFYSGRVKAVSIFINGEYSLFQYRYLLERLRAIGDKEKIKYKKHIIYQIGRNRKNRGGSYDSRK